MTTDFQDRVRWVDIGKGLGIVLVTFGHLRNGSGESVWLPALDVTISVIYMFHMPLFFFLGGFTLSTRRPFPDFVVRKVKTLLVPYYFFSLYFLAKPLAVTMLPTLSSTFQAERQSVLPVFYDVLVRGNGLWFLWAYFWAEIFSYFISKRVVRDSSRAIIGLVLVVLYEITSRFWSIDLLPLQLDKGVLATGFVLLALGLKKFIMSLSRQWDTLAVLLCTATFAASLPLAFSAADLHLATMLSGVFLFAALAIAISRNGILEYIGRFSVGFYVLNAAVLNVAKLLFFRVLNIPGTTLPLVLQILVGLLATAFSLVLLACLNYVIRRWMWWSIGASRPQTHVAAAD
jgi:fucose 4-O-acetylase-like acetyltransferase